MKWLKQTSTIGGLISLAITGVQAYQSGGDALTAVLAVLSAALLLINDGKFLKGLCALAFFSVSATACAGTPLNAETAKAAAPVVCSVVQASGCFDELQPAFPGLDASTCTDIVKAAIDTAVIVQKNFASMPREDAAVASITPLLNLSDKVSMPNWDPLKVDPSSILPGSTCRNAAKALGVK